MHALLPVIPQTRAAVPPQVVVEEKSNKRRVSLSTNVSLKKVNFSMIVQSTCKLITNIVHMGPNPVFSFVNDGDTSVTMIIPA